jgi:hypothetical protein
MGNATLNSPAFHVLTLHRCTLSHKSYVEGLTSVLVPKDVLKIRRHMIAAQKKLLLMNIELINQTSPSPFHSLLSSFNISRFYGGKGLP